jgi:GNAT superfamily N-acetyltransferase
MAKRITIRTATPEDADAVGMLLRASYPALFAGHYDPDILAAALPLMTRANPALLSSGTYYLAELPGRELVGCGGWTAGRPGTGELEAGLGHVRHFGTHPDWTRQGIARALWVRCLETAAADGVTRFECYSSLPAEPFYASLGFRTVKPFAVEMGPALRFPSVLMEYDVG